MDVDSCFFHNTLTIFVPTSNSTCWQRLQQKVFAIQFFHFCDSKKQQRFLFQEEINFSRRQLSSFVESLRAFLKTFDKASESLQIPKLKPTIGIHYLKSTDNLVAQYYQNIIEFSNWHIYLPFRFQNNKSCIFSFKSFELHGNQFILTQNVSRNLCDFHHVYMKRLNVAKKRGVNERKYDL